MDKQQIQKCLFCQQKTSLCNLINLALQYKYEHKIEITIDDFVDSSKKKEIVQFYEKIFDQEEEYLEKQFQRAEQTRRLRTLTEYYKYEIHTPRLYMKKVEKTIRDYQKHKKNFHYNKIKYQLGLNQKDQQTQRIKTEPEKNNNIANNLVLFDLTQEEPSKSVIEMLNLLNNQSKKKVHFATQIKQVPCVTPSIQNSARNQILQKQLKAILQSDVQCAQYFSFYCNTEAFKRSSQQEISSLNEKLNFKIKHVSLSQISHDLSKQNCYQNEIFPSNLTTQKQQLEQNTSKSQIKESKGVAITQIMNSFLYFMLQYLLWFLNQITKN